MMILGMLTNARAFESFCCPCVLSGRRRYQCPAHALAARLEP